MGKPGHPPAYNQEIAQAVIDALRNGQNRPTAALLAGISPRTLIAWFAWGEGRDVSREPAGGDREPYAQFVLQAKRAEKEAVAVLVERIRTAGTDPKFWCANSWLLERMHPEQFSDNRKLLKDMQEEVKRKDAQIAALIEQVKRLGVDSGNPGAIGEQQAPGLEDRSNDRVIEKPADTRIIPDEQV